MGYAIWHVEPIVCCARTAGEFRSVVFAIADVRMDLYGICAYIWSIM